MARKKVEEVPQKPSVTKIPLPASESALVIDLPDGQKLVVGKMEHGTVIEVATWRGTGRPDSRTNRMMLGMSNAEIETELEESEKSPVERIKTLSWQEKLVEYPKIFIRWLLNIEGNGKATRKSKIESNENSPSNVDANSISESKFNIKKFLKLPAPKNLLKKVDARKESFEETPELSEGDETSTQVDEWLEKIMAKSKTKSLVTADIDNRFISPKLEAPAVKKANSPKKSQKSPVKKSSKRK